jgi:Ca2+-binding EF-hand superfamily protein
LLLIDLASSWMKIRHDKALLEAIFKIIDTNSDGFISYKEFITFVRRYLGGRLCSEDFKDPFEGKTEKTEEDFYVSVWSELRTLYKHYVKGKFLTER